MDTLFSDFELTATRLAELLVIPVDKYAERVNEWFVADQRPAKRRNYYRQTKAAIDELHRRVVGIEDLRRRVDEWRLEETAASSQYERDQLKNNIRATTQYLHHTPGQRVFDVDRKLHPPPAVLKSALADAAFDSRHSAQELLEGREVEVVSHSWSLVARATLSRQRSEVAVG